MTNPEQSNPEENRRQCSAQKQLEAEQDRDDDA
jgi:hypothetical protein